MNDQVPTAEEAMNAQLSHTVDQIRNWLRYPSDDGADYLFSALDLSKELFAAYMLDFQNASVEKRFKEFLQKHPASDTMTYFDEFASDGVDGAVYEYMRSIGWKEEE